jgi:hypothetical protein
MLCYIVKIDRFPDIGFEINHYSREYRMTIASNERRGMSDER